MACLLYNGRIVLCNLISFAHFKQSMGKKEEIGVEKFPSSRESR